MLKPRNDRLRSAEPSAYAIRAASTKAKAKRVAAAVPSEAEMLRGLGPAWRRGVGEATLRAAKATGQSLSQEDLRKLVNESVKAETKALELRLKDLTKRTRDRVEKHIANGLAKNQRPETLAARLEGVLGPGRAKTVAMTETHRASNGSVMRVFESLGIDARMWLSERDSRVRPAHKRLDGQTQPIGKPFKIGGHSAMHPGGFDVPELDVNCRCFLRAVKPKRDGDDVEWRALDQQLRKFETAALVVIEREFRSALARCQAVAMGL